MKWLAAACAAAASAAGAASAAAAPAPAPAGRYEAQFCVSTTAGNPGCGPADVELRASGHASVRIADIVYRLKLNSSQVEVVLMQGSMQLDEFTVPYAWAGRTLQFRDDEKNARYEVRLGERRR